MRRLVGVLVVLAVTAGLAACTDDSGDDEAGKSEDEPAPSGEVSVDEGALIAGEEWDAATLDYLTWATSEGLSKSNVPSLVAHLARAERDPSFEFDATQVTPADYREIWDKLDNFKDTGDFDINDFLYLWYPYRDQLSPELQDAIKDHLLSFKYWWTEPTPDGIIDSQYYWTENHQIIYSANEYIAGQAFPDEVFTNSGMTGKEHMEHAEPIIRRWIEFRARYGFAEWLSNVYYMEDFIGLLLLAEFSENEELATLASMALDMLFVEIASHTQAGALGSTHGRSYMKDKLTALDEDNFDMSKLLFDDTEYPYQHVDTAVWMAQAQKYRVPEAVRRIAKSDEVGVVRQRQSLPLDPLAPIDGDYEPEAPYGFDFRDPDNLMVWWGIGGQFPWQVVPLSVETMAQYNLWESDLFKRAGNLKPIVDSSTTEELQDLGLTLARQLNSGLLSEASTYTWRAPEVMLSTAQCWRPGSRGEQNHSWQATLDANAQVFTNHPRADVPLLDDPNANEGYWTGDGGMPCSVQVDNVGISIYAPQYEADTSLGDFDYLPYTHAFFPTEKFDEVVERDGWVFGRKGDGYVALWSYRPTTWRQYDLTIEHTRGLTERFDLMAEGGPDNVWITEVGRAADYESFEAFVDAVTSADVEVSPNSAPTCPAGAACPSDPAAGYQVRYVSPSKGEITFGLDGDEPRPLKVDGKEVSLANENRWDSPWAKVPFDQQQYTVEVEGYTIDLNFESSSRTLTAP